MWQSGRNYQLFRYMLGCNAFGQYPTKFNGGLFTYDPSLIDSSRNFTPDHRNWGRPDLEVAVNTYKYDADVLKFRSHTGWKQDNIFAARLGLTNEAASLTVKKLRDSGRRFPAFWGPGFDWTPDHNWGGSGMSDYRKCYCRTTEGNYFYFQPGLLNGTYTLNCMVHTTLQWNANLKTERSKNWL